MSVLNTQQAMNAKLKKMSSKCQTKENGFERQTEENDSECQIEENGYERQIEENDFEH